MPTQAAIADHLDMSERNAREMLKALCIDWRETSLDDIRELYIRDMREKAAGRGGDAAGALTLARTEESQVKTAKLRLEYMREMNELIITEDGANVLMDWSRQANLDYLQGFSQFVIVIESKYKIKIPQEMVEEIVCSTTERIKAYAKKLGESLVEGSSDIREAEDAADG